MSNCDVFYGNLTFCRCIYLRLSACVSCCYPVIVSSRICLGRGFLGPSYSAVHSPEWVSREYGSTCSRYQYSREIHHIANVGWTELGQLSSL